MKKIIICIFISVLILVGGIAFVSKNFSSTNKLQRNFIVVKGYGGNLYNYNLPFLRGTTYLQIAHELEGSAEDPKKIYVKSGRYWKEVSPHARAYYDSTIKIDE